MFWEGSERYEIKLIDLDFDFGVDRKRTKLKSTSTNCTNNATKSKMCTIPTNAYFKIIRTDNAYRKPSSKDKRYTLRGQFVIIAFYPIYSS